MIRLYAVTFASLLSRGDRIALKGRNGSGKSSIIKLICGEDISYSGSFYKGNQLLISYVPQDTSFLTGDLSAYAYENSIDDKPNILFVEHDSAFCKTIANKVVSI
jgi:ATPase subunit of ABC transporter with duplicated ATPase domains